MLYDIALAKSKELDEQIRSLRKQLSRYSHGNFFCSKNGNSYKWFHNDGQKQIYIPKKNRSFAEKLAAKKYIVLRLEELIKEKRAIDFYLRHHDTSPSPAENLLSHPGYLPLLRPHFSPTNSFKAWANSPYHTNPLYPEHLVHKALSGNYVRSKSETIIDMVLYTHKIPFRYECSLQLGEAITYPDFTIMHPITGKLYYWEHFGLVDVTEYWQKAEAKLQLYRAHGIIPTIQLITTYETKNHPLAPGLVESIVKHYFL